jgi:hypothetical protein
METKTTYRILRENVKIQLGRHRGVDGKIILKLYPETGWSGLGSSGSGQEQVEGSCE